MEAITAFCDLLEACLDNSLDPHPPADMLEAGSMQMALALHRPPQSYALGPPLDSYMLDRNIDAFEPLEFVDGRRKVAFTTRDQGVIALDLASRNVAKWNGPWPSSDPSRSPDGRWYTDRWDFVGVFDAATDQEVRRLTWERDSCEASTSNVVFSADSRLVAVSWSHEQHVRGWNIETAAYLGQFRVRPHEAALTFSPDGKLLFAGTRAGSHLFHLDSGYSIYSNQQQGAYSVGYHPDGDCLVARGPKSIYRVDLTSLRHCPAQRVSGILGIFRANRDVLCGLTQWASDWHRLELLSLDL